MQIDVLSYFPDPRGLYRVCLNEIDGGISKLCPPGSLKPQGSKRSSIQSKFKILVGLQVLIGRQAPGVKGLNWRKGVPEKGYPVKKYRFCDKNAVFVSKTPPQKVPRLRISTQKVSTTAVKPLKNVTTLVNFRKLR